MESEAKKTSNNLKWLAIRDCTSRTEDPSEKCCEFRRHLQLHSNSADMTIFGFFSEENVSKAG